MNQLKKILNRIHAQNKSRVDELYLERMSKIDDEVNLTYECLNLRFYFFGTTFREPEKLILNIDIPESDITHDINTDNSVMVEHYLLKYFYQDIKQINDEYYNKNKSSREKPYVESQKVNEIIIKRNGINHDSVNKVFHLRLLFVVSLINNVTVNGKSTFKMIKEILSVISKKIGQLDKEDLRKNLEIFKKQQEIRKYIKEHNYISFIANDSILPRFEDTNLPLKEAIKFKAPKSLEIVIKFNDGSMISGMGIKKGITVITGGGYSGKTTLLDAIEMGVYNHEYGDGREFCITDDTALKICAEDGRYIANTDISPFFKTIPSKLGIHNFSTQDASGSVSQAVNIIEAINCKCKLLLIDEDRSATNFMIRDYNMHLIVQNDPIIPFTSRIKEIYHNYDTSTILVIGGSSVYLNYADCVILLEDYKLKDITNLIKNLDLMKTVDEVYSSNFIFKRKLKFLKKEQFTYFNLVQNDKSKKIIIDEYQADITSISTIISDNQINYLAYLIQLILLRDEFVDKDIIESIMLDNNELFNEKIKEIVTEYNFKCNIWFEDIRKEDIICCINRLRGITFEFLLKTK